MRRPLPPSRYRLAELRPKSRQVIDSSQSPVRARTHTHQRTLTELPTSPTRLTSPTQTKYIINYETEYITATDRVSALQSPLQDADGCNDLFVSTERSLAEQVSRSVWIFFFLRKGKILMY